MANLTASQKKSRNKFIALLIAIVVVAAAVAYVIYGGLTSTSPIMANQDFADALSEAFGKTEASITEEDMAEVKYFELSYDSTNKVYMLALGYDDFIAAYDEYNEKVDNLAEGETAPEANFTDLAKMVTFEGDEESDLSDVKFFTGVDTISLSSIPVTNEYIASLTNLRNGYFYSCGITDVSGFANLDLTKIEELDLTGNSIADWSALNSISDKVIVANYYTIEADEEGNQTLVPVTQTLTQYNEEQAKAEEEANAETEETAEETAEGAEEATDTTEGTEEATEATETEETTEPEAETAE